MAGFIHNKLDIKLLALYLASRLVGPVDRSTYIDLALCDDGVNYFQFAEAIAQLVENRQLSLEDGLYSITDEGRRNIAEGGDSLSIVIRQRCDQRVIPVNEQLRRKAMIRSCVEPDGNGYRLRLAFSDETGDLLTLTLWTPDEACAQRASERFQRDPGKVYEGVLNAVLGTQNEREGADPG